MVENPEQQILVEGIRKIAQLKVSSFKAIRRLVPLSAAIFLSSVQPLSVGCAGDGSDRRNLHLRLPYREDYAHLLTLLCSLIVFRGGTTASSHP